MSIQMIDATNRMRIIENTVEWIREIVVQSGCRGVIVGLSGGIDSSVVAHLIKRAFPDDSMGVILPCKSSPKDKADGIAVAESANLRYVEVELSQVHESLHQCVTSVITPEEQRNERLTDANLRARLRMTTIYGIANNIGYLVAGTDNAAEVHTGYFTKYGDGGVDFIPIANLTKREVYEWAKVLGVPQSVIERAPSAGLWEGQTDESEMGTTYDAIDDYMEGKEIPSKDKEIIDRLHLKSEHKRVMPPKPPIY